MQPPYPHGLTFADSYTRRRAALDHWLLEREAAELRRGASRMDAEQAHRTLIGDVQEGDASIVIAAKILETVDVCRFGFLVHHVALPLSLDARIPVVQVRWSGDFRVDDGRTYWPTSHRRGKIFAAWSFARLTNNRALLRAVDDVRAAHAIGRAAVSLGDYNPHEVNEQLGRLLVLFGFCVAYLRHKNRIVGLEVRWFGFVSIDLPHAYTEPPTSPTGPKAATVYTRSPIVQEQR